MTSPALGGSVGVMSFFFPRRAVLTISDLTEIDWENPLKRKSRKDREISFRSRRTRKREVEVHFQGLTL